MQCNHSIGRIARQLYIHLWFTTNVWMNCKARVFVSLVIVWSNFSPLNWQVTKIEIEDSESSRVCSFQWCMLELNLTYPTWPYLTLNIAQICRQITRGHIDAVITQEWVCLQIYDHFQTHKPRYSFDICDQCVIKQKSWYPMADLVLLHVTRALLFRPLWQQLMQSGCAWGWN